MNDLSPITHRDMQLAAEKDSFRRILEHAQRAKRDLEKEQQLTTALKRDNIALMEEIEFLQSELAARKTR